MEHITITPTDTELHVEGFPDAVKVIRIGGRWARQVADLALHHHDLRFEAECLDEINRVPDASRVIRWALWRGAIVHYAKCFGHSAARSSLDPARIYGSNPRALEVFEYFRTLRNKHIVHDENSYTECTPGAILNRRDAPFKIAKVVCSSQIAETLDQNNYGNLTSLVRDALAWVSAEFDRLCAIVTKELESIPYDELHSRETLTVTVPKLDELALTRSMP